jgi:cytochrome c biogenesis protein CcmG/thiol:disulfide interchange protein DsbE
MRISILLFTFFAIFTACKPNNDLMEGEMVPDFETYNLKGEKVKISDYRGKVVLLYFWADFCPTCKKEFPATQQYYEKIQGKDFELLAINVGQPYKASKGFYDKYQPTFPMLLDTAGQISKTFAVKELPTNYFINPEGKIERRIIGFVGENQVQVMINQHKK